MREGVFVNEEDRYAFLAKCRPGNAMRMTEGETGGCRIYQMKGKGIV